MIGLPVGWQCWLAWWRACASSRPPASDGPPESDRPSTAASGTDCCPACGQELREAAVPDGYEQPHCLSCAQAIDRRALARHTGRAARR